MQRVVVTGLGCVTPIGHSAAALEEALFAGRSGIGETMPAFAGAPAEGPGLKFRSLARVEGFDASAHLSSGVISVTTAGAQFGVVAARQAAESSGVLEHVPREQIAIVTGCSCGGRDADEDACRVLYTRNSRVSPTAILRTMASSGVSHMAIDLGIQGPVLNVSTACASGTHAIGLAFQMVRSGMAAAALAGGYEAPLTFGFLRAWDSMRVVSPTRCRPFAADRDGMTLGEGAAMLVLETLEGALARGAKIYAEVVGFGMSADAHHVTQPQAQGAAAAMRRALEDAAGAVDPGATVEQMARRVGYINAHGTGTLTNDAVEAAAILEALGEEVGSSVPISGTKSLHGHSIGAVGAIEALATVIALDCGRLPHTEGVGAVDPAIRLDVILGESRAMDPARELALSNSLAFGGLNAVLALRRYTV
jgi:3-oxoacyl-[acyl-carrier-protein] synthase II/nodulation protein E